MKLYCFKDVSNSFAILLNVAANKTFSKGKAYFEVHRKYGWTLGSRHDIILPQVEGMYVTGLCKDISV